MKNKHYILWLLVPLGEIKAIFYNSNKKVDWFLFSDKPKFLCNVLEDYSNILIFGVVFYFLTFVRIDTKIRNTALFLFVLNCLDLVHLGLMDMQYLVIVKLIITYIICRLLKKF